MGTWPLPTPLPLMWLIHTYFDCLGVAAARMAPGVSRGGARGACTSQCLGM